MATLLVPLTSGLLNAMFLFLLASGLSLIFGVSRVLNLAHGSIYMVGAYLFFTLSHHLPGTLPAFIGMVCLASLGAVAFGALIEILLLRRVYAAGELYVALVTFGVILVTESAVKYIWGGGLLSSPLPPYLSGTVHLLGVALPRYNLTLLSVGAVVMVGLWALIHRTRWGLHIRAAAGDQEMASALGINVRRLFTATFLLGSWLAGVAGALAAPLLSLDPTAGAGIIIQTFAVVVIGGLGSLVGSLVAALIVGELQVFGVLVWSGISLPLIFLVMAITLVVRPSGLFGLAEE